VSAGNGSEAATTLPIILLVSADLYGCGDTPDRRLERIPAPTEGMRPVEDLIARLLDAAAPQMAWVALFAMAVITILVIFLGIALVAALLKAGEHTRYLIFRDLVDLFRPRRHERP
jgi:hypothetical protein